MVESAMIATILCKSTSRWRTSYKIDQLTASTIFLLSGVQHQIKRFPSIIESTTAVDQFLQYPAIIAQQTRTNLFH